jgi:chromosome segregation ATPase
MAQNFEMSAQKHEKGAKIRLEQEKKRSQQALSQLKAQCDAAEKQLTSKWEQVVAMNAFETTLSEREVSRLSEVLEERNSDLKQKEDEIKNLELQVKKLNADLETAKKDTAAAGLKILDICKGWKKSKEPALRKNKASDDASASPSKKPKTEPWERSHTTCSSSGGGRYQHHVRHNTRKTSPYWKRRRENSYLQV